MSPRVDVSPGSDRRSVTVTFGYGEHLRSLVARTLREALEDAEARWGKWDTVESISTPDTIYADLIGLTKERRSKFGARTHKGDGHGVSERMKLERLGYDVKPGEVGSLRYGRTELPTLHQDPNDPTAEAQHTPNKRTTHRFWRMDE